MQEVICGLARVIVAHEEGEGGPKGVEYWFDVPAHINECEAPSNPAQASPLLRVFPEHCNAVEPTARHHGHCLIGQLVQ